MRMMNGMKAEDHRRCVPLKNYRANVRRRTANDLASM